MSDIFICFLIRPFLIFCREKEIFTNKISQTTMVHVTHIQHTEEVIVKNDFEEARLVSTPAISFTFSLRFWWQFKMYNLIHV